MKKLSALFLSLIFLFSLAACGGTNASQTTTAAKTDSDSSSESKTDAPASKSQQSNSKKTLVVYYSASGNTKRVAEDIAAATGADLFEIVPTEVYTDDDLNWRKADSRVNREHEDESLRSVPLKTEKVENWEDYDTVFFGYPIWWAIAAWPAESFVKANDFTGKTVIPFATSTSSGLGQSAALLAEAANGGTWQDGKRFSSGASSSEVQSWANSIEGGTTK